MSYQPRLNIPTTARTVLVDIGTTRIRHGVDAESIWAKIDNGGIQWVWDIAAAGSRKRELRFWAKELIAPEFTAGQTLAQVVAEIVGKRTSYPRGEIEVQWVLSHVHLISLIRQNELILTGREITSESLTNFLTSRWQGASRK